MVVLEVVGVGAGVLDTIEFAGLGNKFALDNELRIPIRAWSQPSGAT